MPKDFKKTGVPTLEEVNKLKQRRQTIYTTGHMYDPEYKKELEYINKTIKLYAQYG